MSKGYGWQCESAIIPKSHSRAINNVDNRSILALKALSSSSTSLLKRKAPSEFDISTKSKAYEIQNSSNKKKNTGKEKDLKKGNVGKKSIHYFACFLLIFFTARMMMTTENPKFMLRCLRKRKLMKRWPRGHYPRAKIVTS